MPEILVKENTMVIAANAAIVHHQHWQPTQRHYFCAVRHGAASSLGEYARKREESRN